jgi:DNA-binding transcriptional ArsR family regulator
MPISEYDSAMARAATTSDVFNAIAEPQRRKILVLLRKGERPVTELAEKLGMTQPGASKHLRVLREVGLVRDRREGKQRLYALDARGLRPVHQWSGGFEQFWNESFDRLDAYVQNLKRARQGETIKRHAHGFTAFPSRSTASRPAKARA